MRLWVEAVRQGSFVGRDRVRGYSLIFLVFELISFAYIAAGTHGWIIPLDQPNTSDFVSFYAAGHLANDGTPALAYDRAAHFASEQRATEAGIPYNFFFYPPVFLLICAGLARLPYLVAFTLFEAGSLVACLAVVRRIVGPVPIGTLLAFPAVFWAVGTGQNALLTAALLGAALLTLERRPVLAGLLLGALCYKPHFGLLVPVALAAGGHWRAFAAASVSVAGVVAASVLAFGVGTWAAFFDAASGAGAIYGGSSAPIDLAGLTSPFGLMLALGRNPAAAIGLQAVVTAAAALAVAWVWACRSELAVRAAVLAAAIPVAVPIVMFYDLMLTGLALAWLVRDGVEHGFPPWQRVGLAALFLLPIMSGNLGFDRQIGIPPVSAALGLILALRQAIWSGQLQRHPGIALSHRVLIGGAGGDARQVVANVGVGREVDRLEVAHRGQREDGHDVGGGEMIASEEGRRAEPALDMVERAAEPL